MAERNRVPNDLLYVYVDSYLKACTGAISHASTVFMLSRFWLGGVGPPECRLRSPLWGLTTALWPWSSSRPWAPARPSEALPLRCPFGSPVCPAVSCSIHMCMYMHACLHACFMTWCVCAYLCALMYILVYFCARVSYAGCVVVFH